MSAHHCHRFITTWSDIDARTCSRFIIITMCLSRHSHESTTSSPSRSRPHKILLGFHLLQRFPIATIIASHRHREYQPSCCSASIDSSKVNLRHLSSLAFSRQVHYCHPLLNTLPSDLLLSFTCWAERSLPTSCQWGDDASFLSWQLQWVCGSEGGLQQSWHLHLRRSWSKTLNCSHHQWNWSSCFAAADTTTAEISDGKKQLVNEIDPHPSLLLILLLLRSPMWRNNSSMKLILTSRCSDDSTTVEISWRKRNNSDNFISICASSGTRQNPGSMKLIFIFRCACR